MAKTRLSHWIACYDIRCDRERRRIERLLLGWGFRVQKSVFTVVTTRYKAMTLQTAIQDLGLETGYVLLIRKQYNCPVISIGEVPPNLDGDSAYIF